MIKNTDELFLLSVFIATIGIIAFVAAIVLLARKSLLNKNVLQVNETVKFFPCAGPFIRLSFESSLDPALFAQAVEADCVQKARAYLGAYIGDTANLSLQSLTTWLSRSELIVRPSAQAMKALRDGTAYIQKHKKTGARMGHIMNKVSNHQIEVMKEVKVGAKLVRSTAATAAMAISIAHMISSADLARSLKLMDQKIDLLLAYRRVDQESKLERTYAAAKELLGAPLNEAKRIELWRMRSDLRELRANWRREAELSLKLIVDPKDEGNWLSSLLTTQSGQDSRIGTKINNGLAQLMVLEYSLRLDRILAAASDTWMESEGSLHDELSSLSNLAQLVEDKARLISKDSRSSVQPIVDCLRDVVDHYHGLIAVHPGTILEDYDTQVSSKLLLDE